MSRPSFHPEVIDGAVWDYKESHRVALDRKKHTFEHLGARRGVCLHCGKDHTITRELSAVVTSRLKRLRRHPLRDVVAQHFVEKRIAKHDPSASSTCTPDIEFHTEFMKIEAAERAIADAVARGKGGAVLGPAVSTFIETVTGNLWYMDYLGEKMPKEFMNLIWPFWEHMLTRRELDPEQIAGIKETFHRGGLSAVPVPVRVVFSNLRVLANLIELDHHAYHGSLSDKFLVRHINEFIAAFDRLMESLPPMYEYFDALREVAERGGEDKTEKRSTEPGDEDSSDEGKASSSRGPSKDELSDALRAMRRGGEDMKRDHGMTPESSKVESDFKPGRHRMPSAGGHSDPSTQEALKTLEAIDKHAPDRAWNNLKIVKQRYVKEVPPWKIQRGKARATEEGIIPQKFERIASDQRIYVHKLRVPSVSVLIDASGSMALDADDIREIIDLLPGSTIASYAGYDHDPSDGAPAELWILADNGKIIDLSNRENLRPWHLGGNGVDMPALQWLAEQPGPRLWISDGQAICPNIPMRTAKEECYAFAHLAGIERVDNMPQALEAVRKRTRIADWKRPALPQYRRNWERRR